MEVRLDCLKYGCCECCKDTKMQLSEEDIRKIEQLGYKRDDFSMEIDGVRVLKNVNGSCYFLKSDMCSIYNSRPVGCRLYPVIYHVDNKKAVIDDFCPHSENINQELLKRAERVLINHIIKIYGFLP